MEKLAFDCESCDRGFRSFEELERHVVEEHLDMSNKPPRRGIVDSVSINVTILS